jgi:glycosyltransferase involved in cell wall biosynthesis
MVEERRVAKQQVLQVCHSYYPPYLDVARQYNALFDRAHWHITTVFLTGASDPAIADQIGSDTVIFLEHESRALRGFKRAQIRQLREIAAANRFAFAIAHRYKALYICTHVPGLFTFGVHHRPGGYKRWTRRFYVRGHRQSLALLGVSDAVRDNMRRSLPDFPPEKIETLYNHIDPQVQRAELLERAQARAHLQLPADVYLFGNVGRLHPDKDQATLIRAFARSIDRLGDARLVLVGKGRLEQNLKALAAELGVADRVLFTGPVPDARRYFAAFDSFVLSSDHEPFGMVLLEAMAARLPIAATDCGGAGEVVGDAGLTFALGDVAGLAEVLCRLQALDAAGIDAMQARLEERLQRLFTDRAVRAAFWSLPAVRELARARGIGLAEDDV